MIWPCPVNHKPSDARPHVPDDPAGSLSDAVEGLVSCRFCTDRLSSVSAAPPVLVPDPRAEPEEPPSSLVLMAISWNIASPASHPVPFRIFSGTLLEACSQTKVLAVPV